MGRPVSSVGITLSCQPTNARCRIPEPCRNGNCHSTLPMTRWAMLLVLTDRSARRLYQLTTPVSGVALLRPDVESVLASIIFPYTYEAENETPWDNRFSTLSDPA